VRRRDTLHTKAQALEETIVLPERDWAKPLMKLDKTEVVKPD